MWSLINEKTGKTHPLKNQEVVVVGRKLCPGNLTITLEDDGSISKKHALIKADGPNLTINDVGSKYGTFLLKGSEAIKITDYVTSHNDQIRFGVQQSIFRVINRSILGFKVLPSGVQKHQIDKLYDNLQKLGCEVLEQFSPECTHVTTETGELTAKIACALAAAIPIVTLSFWPQYLMFLDKKEIGVPQIQDFVPVMDKMIIDNRDALIPNQERQHLFKGQTFVFFAESQLHMYEQMIKLAGGKAVMFSDPILKTPIKSMIVQPPPDCEKPPAYAKVLMKLERKKKHAISDDQIPLAILHCNLEKHCNPEFEWVGMLFSAEPVSSLGSILAAETQNLNPAVVKNATVIPESMSESQWALDSTNKPAVSSDTATTAIPSDASIELRRNPYATESSVGNSRKRPAAALDSAGADSPTKQALQPAKRAREIDDPVDKPSRKRKQLSLAAFLTKDPPSRVPKGLENITAMTEDKEQHCSKKKSDQTCEEIRPVSSSAKPTENVLSPPAKALRKAPPLSPNEDQETAEKPTKTPFKKAVPRRGLNSNEIVIHRNMAPIVVPARRLTRRDMQVWAPKGKK